MPKLIVSLSTIPNRFHLINPTLKSLLNQSIQADEIRLNIPHSYRRFPDAKIVLPQVPDGITVHRVEEDIGPATKILPTIAEFSGQDVEIIGCDDDQDYPANLFARMMEARNDHPNSCIAGRGYDLKSNAKLGEKRTQPRGTRRKLPKDARYRFLRAISLGNLSTTEEINGGYVDILTGVGSFMVRPEFFPSYVFDIPEEFRMVDDPWLSGHLAANGVPIWQISSPSRIRRKLASQMTSPLVKHVEQGNGRSESDASCIRYLQDTYDIWPHFRDADEPETPAPPKR